MLHEILIQNDWTPPFAKYEQDPIGFIQKEQGVKHVPKDWTEVFNSVRDNRITNVQKSRAIDESFWIANLLIWWVFAVGGKAVIIAPSINILKILWNDIEQVHEANKKILGGLCKNFKLVANENALAYAYGTTMDGAINGIFGDKLLLIQVQTERIFQEVNDGFDSCLTGRNNRGLILSERKGTALLD